MLNLPGHLEVTVEDDMHMDLSEFDLAKHAGVLLDGVGDAMMLKRHREALQGRVKNVPRGQVCHHDVFLCIYFVSSSGDCVDGLERQELAHVRNGPLVV